MWGEREEGIDVEMEKLRRDENDKYLFGRFAKSTTVYVPLTVTYCEGKI